MAPPRLFLLLLSIVLTADSVRSADLETVFSKEMINRAKRACVLIEVETAQGKGHGSGVRFNSEGWIATNFHVIAGAKKIKVTDLAGTQEEVAELMYYSPQRDIALFKTKASPDFLGFNRTLSVSSPVIAVGHPLDERWKVTEGTILKVFPRKNREEIHIDAEIAPGSSGGPILAKDGTICGLSTYLLQLSFRDGQYRVARVKLFFGVSKSSIVNIPVEKIKPVKISTVEAFGEGWVVYDEQLPILISEIDKLLRIFYSKMASQVLKKEAAGTGRTEIGGNSAFLRFRYELSDPNGLQDLIAQYRALAVFINKYIPENPKDPNLREAGLLLKAALRHALQSAENLALIHGMANDQGEGYFLRSARSRSLAAAAIRDAVHSYSKARLQYGDHSFTSTESEMDVVWTRYIPGASPPWAAKP